MACSYTEHKTAPVAEIRVTGHVTQHDMDEMLPKLEAFIGKHGTVRLIEIIESFEGADPSTFFDGMKFDVMHLQDVTHVAVVSDIPWIGFLSRAASMVMPVLVRTFTLDQLADARKWVENPA